MEGNGKARPNIYITLYSRKQEIFKLKCIAIFIT